MPIIVGSGGETSIQTGVCAAWADLTAVPASIRTDIGDDDGLTQALMAASEELYWLSGRQYPGSCTDLVRPCSRSVSVDPGRPIRGGAQSAAPYGWWPGPIEGDFSAWGFCSCNRREGVGCNSVPAVTLGAYPVTSITAVKIDGMVVDAASYRVDDHRWLVRTGDPNPGWPCCQRVDLPDTEPETWSVALHYGAAPPVLGGMAAIELAYQFALALDPARAGDCALPSTVTNMVRQGQTVALTDPFALTREGFLGLLLCDRFIKGTNPSGIDRPARVLSPDLPRRVVRTTWP